MRTTIGRVVLAVALVATLGSGPAVGQAPLSLLERALLSESADFRRRIRIAMLLVAVEVLREDPATEAHATRARLASVAIREPGLVVERLASVMVIAPTIAPDVSDTALLVMIRGNWSVFASAFGS